MTTTRRRAVALARAATAALIIAAAAPAQMPHALADPPPAPAPDATGDGGIDHERIAQGLKVVVWLAILWLFAWTTTPTRQPPDDPDERATRRRS